MQIDNQYTKEDMATGGIPVGEVNTGAVDSEDVRTDGPDKDLEQVFGNLSFKPSVEEVRTALEDGIINKLYAYVYKETIFAATYTDDMKQFSDSFRGDWPKKKTCLVLDLEPTDGGEYKDGYLARIVVKNPSFDVHAEKELINILNRVKHTNPEIWINICSCIFNLYISYSPCNQERHHNCSLDLSEFVETNNINLQLRFVIPHQVFPRPNDKNKNDISRISVTGLVSLYRTPNVKLGLMTLDDALKIGVVTDATTVEKHLKKIKGYEIVTPYNATKEKIAAIKETWFT